MNHTDHVNLLRNGVPTTGGIWADFGAGTGAFTLALADLIGEDGKIFAIDKDAQALRTQERAMRHQFPHVTVQYRPADFTQPLDLPPLDGLVMANSLHFQRNQEQVVRLLKSYLRPGGRLLIVEYNIERGNFAVPYPVSYRAWQQLAERSGFTQTNLLATRPSRFLSEIYAAASWDSAMPAQHGI
jgi:ubiquinone/menaquinone biosynthesis C-methylase UbiE